MQGLTLPAFTATDKCTLILHTTYIVDRRTNGRTDGRTNENSDTYFAPCCKNTDQFTFKGKPKT